MPRSGSGTYTLPSVTPPIQAGASIAAASMNTTLADLATAMTGSAAADGQTPITGNWDFNSKNISGVNTLAATGAATFGSTVAITGTATAASGTSGTQVVNYGQFPATLASPGTTTLPNGLIMKWGTGTTAVGFGSVGFATAFPTAVFNVQITISGATGVLTVSPLALGATTTSGFQVWGNVAEGFGFNWVAIGH